MFIYVFLGFVSETKRITDVVSDILNRADLIIMGENDSVFFLFETENVFFQIKDRRGSCHKLIF